MKVALATIGMRGCTADDYSLDNPVIFDERVADIVDAAAGSATATHIHRSCALPSHLCTHSQPTLPYIGLSEAPCTS
ncbi:hypothetical protein VTO73DRAFT_15546 [Trametes versicolor]